MPDPLEPGEVESFCEASPDWRLRDGELVAHFEMTSFPVAIRLVDETATAAEEADHHPDIDIRWRTVTFRLSTHSSGGITELDVALAQRISALAALLHEGEPSAG